MSWSQRYDAHTRTKIHLKPVYVLFQAVQEAYYQGSGLSSYSDAFEILSYSDFLCTHGETLFVYDNNGWELMRVDRFSEDFPDANHDSIWVNRDFDNSKTFGQHTRVMRLPQWCLSTQDITELPQAISYMSFPSGYSTSLDFREGRTEIGEVKIQVQDHKGQMSQHFAASDPLGARAVILGGYEGMALTDFSLLYTGKITGKSYKAGVYNLTLDAGFAFDLNTERFNQIESAETHLGADIVNDSVTSMRLNAWSDVYAATYAWASGIANAGMYFRITDGENIEIVKQAGAPDANGNITITRGQLGTTAQSFFEGDPDIDGGISANGVATIKYFLYIYDEGINVMLHLLMSGNPALSAQDYGFHFGSETDESLGLAFAPPDINIGEFERIRDNWLPNQFQHFYFHGPKRIRNYIEQHILKPSNINLYLDNSGRLSLSSVVAPVATETIENITQDDLRDVPELDFNMNDVVNIATIKWEYNPWEDEYANNIRYVDSDSINNLNRESNITLESDGLRSTDQGKEIATSWVENKVTGGTVTPTIRPISLSFQRGAYILPGSLVRFSHDNLPDNDTGEIGIVKYMRVKSKDINWDNGTIELEVKATIYDSSGRYGLITSDTQVDFTSAATSEVERYMFICDDDGKMSDGTDGYNLY